MFEMLLFYWISFYMYACIAKDVAFWVPLLPAKALKSPIHPRLVGKRLPYCFDPLFSRWRLCLDVFCFCGALNNVYELNLPSKMVLFSSIFIRCVWDWSCLKMCFSLQWVLMLWYRKRSPRSYDGIAYGYSLVNYSMFLDYPTFNSIIIGWKYSGHLFCIVLRLQFSAMCPGIICTMHTRQQNF